MGMMKGRKDQVIGKSVALSLIEGSYLIMLAPDNQCWHSNTFSEFPHFLVSLSGIQQIPLD